jgi:hypothetical protein
VLPCDQIVGESQAMKVLSIGKGSEQGDFYELLQLSSSQGLKMFLKLRLHRLQLQKNFTKIKGYDGDFQV